MPLFQTNSTDVADVLGLTDRLIREFGPRLPGSEACLAAADRLKTEYGKHCDRVFTDDFDLAPDAFFYTPSIVAATYLAGCLFFMLSGRMILSAIFWIAGFLYFVDKYILFGSALDFLFRRRPGRNVCGIIEPDGPPERQVVFVGHHDSPYILNFLTRHQKLYGFRVVLPMCFYLYGLAASILLLRPGLAGAGGESFLHASRIVLIAGLAWVIPMFRVMSRKGSPGAGDNLVASVMGIKIAEIVKRRLTPPARTRIVLLSTDGEELGQKGAQAFIRQNKSLLGECETFVFNMDSIYRREDLTFLTSDRNGTIRLSARLAEENAALSSRLGVAVKKRKFPFGGGGTDAARFAAAGIEAASLVGISTDFIRDRLVYHTEKDIVQNLEPEAIEAALNIAVNFILTRDMSGSAEA
jgi:aminopeptidase YwaD